MDPKDLGVELTILVPDQCCGHGECQMSLVITCANAAVLEYVPAGVSCVNIQCGRCKNWSALCLETYVEVARRLGCRVYRLDSFPSREQAETLRGTLGVQIHVPPQWRELTKDEERFIAGQVTMLDEEWMRSE